MPRKAEVVEIEDTPIDVPPKDTLDPEQVKQEKQENEKPVVVKKRGRPAKTKKEAPIEDVVKTDSEIKTVVKKAPGKTKEIDVWNLKGEQVDKISVVVHFKA